MNGQWTIIEQCDKMIKLLDEAQTSLGEASKIAKDYLEYRSKGKKISSNSMLSDSVCPRCGKDLMKTTSEQIYCVCGYEK